MIYDPLSDIQIREISALLLQEVTKRLKDHEITVSWDQSVIDRIALLGYDSELGARPLKRAITEYIINPLSEKILSEGIVPGDTIRVLLADNSSITIEKL